MDRAAAVEAQSAAARYLTLAPMAATWKACAPPRSRGSARSRAPDRLSAFGPAWLPEKRRPDRNAEAARAARDRVLERMVTPAFSAEREAARAALEEVPSYRRAIPSFAAHATLRARRTGEEPPRLTIIHRVQEGGWAVAREAAAHVSAKTVGRHGAG